MCSAQVLRFLVSWLKAVIIIRDEPNDAPDSLPSADRRAGRRKEETASQDQRLRVAKKAEPMFGILAVAPKRHEFSEEA